MRMWVLSSGWSHKRDWLLNQGSKKRLELWYIRQHGSAVYVGWWWLFGNWAKVCTIQKTMIPVHSPLLVSILFPPVGFSMQLLDRGHYPYISTGFGGNHFYLYVYMWGANALTCDVTECLCVWTAAREIYDELGVSKCSYVCVYGAIVCVPGSYIVPLHLCSYCTSVWGSACTDCYSGVPWGGNSSLASLMVDLLPLTIILN